MAVRKARERVEAVAIPTDREEAAEWIDRIGARQRERAAIEKAMNDEIAEVRRKHRSEAKPLAEEIAEKTQGIHLWAVANRGALTRDGKVKFHKLATGAIRWRARPNKVSIRGVQDVIERLKATRMTRFLREKVEIDKEAMLREPEAAAAVEGVRIGSAGEDFVITPDITELDEEVAE